VTAVECQCWNCQKERAEGGPGVVFLMPPEEGYGNERAAPLNILDEANRLTAQDRNESYGPPIEDFTKTVGMWNALLSKKLVFDLTVEDFCLMMACVKISRLEATPGHTDSLVDLAGYARCYQLCIEAL
jgi:hypothetical protein